MISNRAVPVLIVGCGRRDCGDDALGILIAERLVEMRLPGVEVCLEEAPDVGLLDRLQPAGPGDAPRALIFVDAALAAPEHPVGTWRKIDYRRDSDMLLSRAPAGTHALSIAEILGLADALGVLPQTVWVYAVFGEQFELASTPSATALGLVSEIVEAIGNDVRALADVEVVRR
ncbi:MAG: hydrogenase maturation protease [bacterium]|nr:hydrogenase maturation protease [bacterium]